MSSYLNFYLLPKKSENLPNPKPLRFVSYSRSCDIYRCFVDNLNVPYIGNDGEDKMLELSAGDVQEVLQDMRDSLMKVQERLALRMEACTKLGKEISEDILEDYVSTTEYVNELKNTVSQIESIADWINELEYSDFEKVFINYD